MTNLDVEQNPSYHNRENESCGRYDYDYGYDFTNGQVYRNTSGSAYGGASWSTNDFCSFAIDNTKRIILKDFTLINTGGGVCLSVGYDDTGENQKACVELYDMSIRHLKDEQGDHALDIANGATVIAKRCEFSNVGSYGLEIKGIGSKATLYNCAICNNDAAGVFCSDGALVELYGEDTIMQSNGEDDLQCDDKEIRYNNTTCPICPEGTIHNQGYQHRHMCEGISGSIVIYIPSLVIKNYSQQAHIYQQLSPSSSKLTYLLYESEEENESEEDNQDQNEEVEESLLESEEASTADNN